MGSELVPPVRIEDDGELDEVRRVLEGLDIPYAEASDQSLAHPALLISSLRRAVGKGAGSGACGRFHIVVAEKLSRTMQQELRRLQPDFLLERPVDPMSLRLLILHAPYGGPERRRSERAAMRAVVKYRSGLLTRKATLVDLSQSGCRLVSSRPLEPGERLQIRLPRELSGRTLALEGRVVAADDVGELEAGAHAASIAFTPLDAATRELIRSVMAAHAVGSGPLRPHPPSPLPGEPSQPTRSSERGQESAAASANAGERRGAPRAVFERSVLAAGRGGAHVLIGRDLSSGGMRVAPDPSLGLGDSFNLVIHAPGRRPTVVRAVVARDDGDAGWLLRFDGGSAALAEIVAALPSLPGAAADAPDQPNVVVSEVLGAD